MKYNICIILFLAAIISTYNHLFLARIIRWLRAFWAILLILHTPLILTEIQASRFWKDYQLNCRYNTGNLPKIETCWVGVFLLLK